LAAGILESIHLSVQNGAAFLHSAIVAAADDFSGMHNHAADRYTAFSEALMCLCNGAAEKLVLEIRHRNLSCIVLIGAPQPKP
jgi:hypothetical protein